MLRATLHEVLLLQTKPGRCRIFTKPCALKSLLGPRLDHLKTTDKDKRELRVSTRSPEPGEGQQSPAPCGQHRKTVARV